MATTNYTKKLVNSVMSSNKYLVAHEQNLYICGSIIHHQITSGSVPVHKRVRVCQNWNILFIFCNILLILIYLIYVTYLSNLK